jgi:hypothetical protein
MAVQLYIGAEDQRVGALSGRASFMLEESNEDY